MDPESLPRIDAEYDYNEEYRSASTSIQREIPPVVNGRDYSNVYQSFTGADVFAEFQNVPFSVTRQRPELIPLGQLQTIAPAPELRFRAPQEQYNQFVGDYVQAVAKSFKDNLTKSVPVQVQDHYCPQCGEVFCLMTGMHEWTCPICTSECRGYGELETVKIHEAFKRCGIMVRSIFPVVDAKDIVSEAIVRCGNTYIEMKTDKWELRAILKVRGENVRFLYKAGELPVFEGNAYAQQSLADQILEPRFTLDDLFMMYSEVVRAGVPSHIPMADTLLENGSGTPIYMDNGATQVQNSTFDLNTYTRTFNVTLTPPAEARRIEAVLDLADRQVISEEEANRLLEEDNEGR